MMAHEHTQLKIAQTLRKVMERELADNLPKRFARAGLSVQEQIALWAGQPDHPDSLRITELAIELHGRKDATLKDDVRRAVFAKLAEEMQQMLDENASSTRMLLSEIEREWREG